MTARATTVPPRVLWAHDSGRVECQEHAGSYLDGAVRARPRARKHRTPLGTWTRVTAGDVKAWKEYGPTIPPLVCETCKAPPLVAR